MSSSFINLMGNDVWTDIDILARQRATIASIVSSDRQDELRTIMIGYLAGMRTATPAELAEVAMIKSTTEAAYAVTIQARLDMALLAETLAIEPAFVRLDRPLVQAVPNPVPNTSPPSPTYVAILNQSDLDQDALDRAAALAVVTPASQPAKDLARLRNPLPAVTLPVGP